MNIVYAWKMQRSSFKNLFLQNLFMDSKSVQVPIGNCWEGPFFVYFVGTLSQYQCQNWGSLLAAPAPDRGHCTTLHGFSTSCRAEQQKQSLSLDMSYTYSLFILLGSSYILLDINISRWNIFSIDEIIFSLSLLHVAPGPAPGRRKLGGGRDHSVSGLQEASSSSHHHIAPPGQLCRAQLLQQYVHPYSSHSCVLLECIRVCN